MSTCTWCVYLFVFSLCRRTWWIWFITWVGPSGKTSAPRLLISSLTLLMERNTGCVVFYVALFSLARAYLHTADAYFRVNCMKFFNVSLQFVHLMSEMGCLVGSLCELTHATPRGTQDLEGWVWPLLFSCLISGQMLNDDTFWLFNLFLPPLPLETVFHLDSSTFPSSNTHRLYFVQQHKAYWELVGLVTCSQGCFPPESEMLTRKGGKRTASAASFYVFCAWSGSSLNLLYCDSEWQGHQE